MQALLTNTNHCGAVLCRYKTTTYYLLSKVRIIVGKKIDTSDLLSLVGCKQWVNLRVPVSLALAAPIAVCLQGPKGQSRLLQPGAGCNP